MILYFNFYFNVETKTKITAEERQMNYRDGSRAAATSKMECFVITVNGFQPLTIITKHSILDVEAALDPPVNIIAKWINYCFNA